jgi:hypothetical protein
MRPLPYFRHFRFLCIATASFLGLGAQHAKADIPAFTVNTVGSPPDYQAGIPVNLGNVFTVNSSGLMVDALGIYDDAPYSERI